MAQDITVSGLTARTRPLFPSASGSLSLAVVPLRALSAGGLAVTVLTTVTPTPKRTLTPFARASGTPTLAGWL